MMKATLCLLLSALAHGATTPHYTTETRPLYISRSTLYVGHYGESFNFDADVWALLTPRLKNDIEVIRFKHLWLDGIHPEPPVREEDFDHPENYGPQRLAQILVIPQKHRAYSDLADLRTRKAEELTKQGFVFKTADPPIPLEYWPAGTFAVYTKEPYHLIQIYAEHDGNLYILTGSDPVGDFTKLAVSFTQAFGIELPTGPSPKQPLKKSPYKFISLPTAIIGLILWMFARNGRFTGPLAAAAIGAGALSLIMGVGGYWLVRLLGLPTAEAPFSIRVLEASPLLTAAALIAWRLRRLSGAKRWILAGLTAAALLFFLLLLKSYFTESAENFSPANDYAVFMFLAGFGMGACLGATFGPLTRPARR